MKLFTVSYWKFSGYHAFLMWFSHYSSHKFVPFHSMLWSCSSSFFQWRQSLKILTSLCRLFFQWSFVCFGKPFIDCYTFLSNNISDKFYTVSFQYSINRCMGSDNKSSFYCCQSEIKINWRKVEISVYFFLWKFQLQECYGPQNIWHYIKFQSQINPTVRK